MDSPHSNQPIARKALTSLLTIRVTLMIVYLARQVTTAMRKVLATSCPLVTNTSALKAITAHQESTSSQSSVSPALTWIV